MLSAPEPLAEHHQLADFDSGESSLDDWLKRRAAKNQTNGSSRMSRHAAALGGLANRKYSHQDHATG